MGELTKEDLTLEHGDAMSFPATGSSMKHDNLVFVSHNRPIVHCLVLNPFWSLKRE